MSLFWLLLAKFHPKKLVSPIKGELIVACVLSTLELREVVSGLAECLLAGLLSSEERCIA